MITNMKAQDIDKVLADLWYAEAVLRGRIKQMEERFAYNTIHPNFRNASVTKQYTVEIPEKKESLEANQAEAAPYQAEYKRRPWNRYYVVKQSNGHVHRGTNCTTCFATTEYGWLTNLSDCDEGQMIEEYGEKACTVCFPNAPVHPAFVKSQEEREAAEKAKADSICRGGDSIYRGRYARCLACGNSATVTMYGALRAHKKVA